MAEHTPSEETAKDCFLDGAAGEFLPEDWDAFLARVRAEAAREALDGLADWHKNLSDRHPRFAGHHTLVLAQIERFVGDHYPQQEADQ